MGVNFPVRWTVWYLTHQLC